MSKQLNTLAAALHDEGALKVWSLIITFFGDSIVNRGGNVSASTVQKVLERVEIGPGAVRTAFSRLASDGWVTREKQGRRSFYQLTDEGFSPFVTATRRIYSAIEPADSAHKTWLLGMHQNKSALLNLPIEHAVQLPNRCVLIANPNERASKLLEELNFLTIQGDCGDIPDWVIEHLAHPDCSKHFNDLQSAFKKLSDRLPSEPLCALVARTLLIHQWRRLLLRYPLLPHELKGDTLAAENECRAFVGKLYHSLTGPAEQWLEEYGSSVSGALPTSSSNVAERFTQQYMI